MSTRKKERGKKTGEEVEGADKGLISIREKSFLAREDKTDICFGISKGLRSFHQSVSGHFRYKTGHSSLDGVGMRPLLTRTGERVRTRLHVDMKIWKQQRTGPDVMIIIRFPNIKKSRIIGAQLISSTMFFNP
jgi:hypothetical protein